MQKQQGSKFIFDPNYLHSKEAYEDELEICRHDLLAFTEKTFEIISPHTPFIYGWHLEAISCYLQACYDGEIKRLIINIPPRYLKSISVNCAFSAFWLGKNPAMKIMSASYAKELSVSHSVATRFMMESQFYKDCFPGTRIAEDDNQKTKYVTTARGQRFATSVGASATGIGGNLLLVDDPHSAMDAASDTIRNSQIEWFDRTYSTRLDNKETGVIVVVMQRLHQNDLSGHLLANGGWEHLNLPAIFEKKTIIDFGNFRHVCEKDSLLHPEREDRETLAQVKRTLGSWAWAGQYQQNPVPDGGGIFKQIWFQMWPSTKSLPKFEYVCQSWDTAFSDKTENDPTAFTAWGIFRPGKDMPYCALLLDAWQSFMEYPELRKKALREYKTCYGEGDGRRADICLIEDKGSGISLRQDLIRAGIPVQKYNPGKDSKVQRAHVVSYLVENGLVYLPESDKFPGRTYAWADEVVQQLCAFPKAEHDDFVDSTVQALNLLKDMQLLRVKRDDEDNDDDKPEPTVRVNPYAQ